MGTSEMQSIGQWMLDALRNADNDEVIQRIRGQVSELCEQFPAPA
jgi:glycine hydroxymethyltransferase